LRIPAAKTRRPYSSKCCILKTDILVVKFVFSKNPYQQHPQDISSETKKIGIIEYIKVSLRLAGKLRVFDCPPCCSVIAYF